MDSLFSFPVGLFHPLQHAGLSRRTPDGRLGSSPRCSGHRQQIEIISSIQSAQGLHYLGTLWRKQAEFYLASP